MLITPKLLGKRLHVPAAWLVEEAKAGRLPHVAAGDAILFDDDAVVIALERRARDLPADERHGGDAAARQPQGIAGPGEATGEPPTDEASNSEHGDDGR